MNVTICVEVDPCVPDPCEHGGVCNADASGGYQCQCPAGYEGDRCEQGRFPLKYTHKVYITLRREDLYDIENIHVDCDVQSKNNSINK